jgi:hypothetical protein
MTVGGVSTQAVFTQPPFTAQRGGDAFFEYSVPIPPSGPADLTFQAGILDSASGQRGPMTFEVAINGTVLWTQTVGFGGWQEGSLNLAGYRGQTVNIRFITDPGPSGNPNFGWGGWSAMQLTVAGASTVDGVSLAVPAALTSANVVATGGSASVNNGSASVSGLPSGGTILVFTGTPTAISAGQSLLDIPFTLSQSPTGQLAGSATTAYAGTGQIGPATSGGVYKPSTLNAFGPANGQTIFSWLVKLPSAPALALSFSTGMWDGRVPSSQGYLMSVRVNGTILWQRNINTGSGWNYGAVDLTAWTAQTPLIELITDTQGPNYNDFTNWAELSFSAVGSGVNCGISLSSHGPVSVPNAGASGTISVTASSGCDWSAQSESGWITTSASAISGNGTVTYSIAPNLGAARQSTLVVGGYEIPVSQAGYSRCDLDQDGFTDVLDAQTIIREALGLQMPADDLRQNGLINVVDVQIVLNAAAGLGCSPGQ